MLVHRLQLAAHGKGVDRSGRSLIVCAGALEQDDLKVQRLSLRAFMNPVSADVWKLEYEVNSGVT